MKSNRKAIINLVLMLVMLVVNGLGSMGWINNMSQKEVSDQFMTLITPSPMTFSIWGLIYGLLLVAMLVMVFRQEDPYYQKVLDEFTFLLRLSFIANMGWIIAFSYEQLLVSIVLILVLLLVVIRMAQKLLSIPSSNRWLLPITFGVYGAWLLVATFVNIAAWLVQIGWDRFGLSESFWAVIVLIIGIIAMLLMTFILKNAVFPLVWVWAFYGIYTQLQVSLGGTAGIGSLSQLLFLVLWIGMALGVAMSIIQLLRNQWKIIPMDDTVAFGL